MFENAELASFVPDKPGRGGCKTGLHSFLSQPIHDTRRTWGVHVHEAAWRTDPAATVFDKNTFPGGPDGLPGGDKETRSAYVFNYYSMADGGASSPSTPVFISHVRDVSNYNYIYRHGYGANGTLLLTQANNNYPVPATFAAVQNRLVYAWGYGKARIWDAAAPTLAGYALGLPQPATAPGYTISRPVTTKTTAISILTGQTYFACELYAGPGRDGTTYAALAGLKKNAHLTIQGVSGFIAELDAVTVFAAIGTITSWPGGSANVTINVPLSPPGAYVGLLLRAKDSPTRDGIIKALTVNEQTTAITLDQVRNATGGYTGAYELKGALLKLTSTWSGLEYVSGGAYGLASIGYPTGALSWVGRGPQYAYAYYDYKTGHISNVSPLIQVTEQDESAVNVTLDLTYFSLPTDSTERSELLARCGYAVIFRSLLSGGATLFPFGPLPSVSGAGAHVALTYPMTGTWADTHPDTDLLVKDTLVAPLTTNGRPMRLDDSGPATVNAVAYHDGRLWCSVLDDPTAVLFSADPAQCLFGVAFESFPGRNRIRVAAEDGRVLGFRLFGDRLVVLTEKFAYYVSGNNEANYRFQRYGASMGGVGPYQVDEIPAEAEGEDSSLIFLHRDKHVYAYTPGSKPKSIGEPITDIIRGYADSNAAYERCRVSVGAIDGRAFVILRLFRSSDSFSRYFLYDLENGIWTENSAKLDGYDNKSGQHFFMMQGGGYIKALMAESGGWWEWLGYRSDETIATGLNPFIETFPMDFGLPKVLKQLNFIRLYVSNSVAGVNGWQATITVNEAFQLAGQPHEPTQKVQSLYAGGDNTILPVDGQNVKELVLFPQECTVSHKAAEIQAPSNYVPNALFFYRLAVKLAWPTQLVGVKLFGFQVCWSRVGKEGVTPP